MGGRGKYSSKGNRRKTYMEIYSGGDSSKPTKKFGEFIKSEPKENETIQMKRLKANFERVKNYPDSPEKFAMLRAYQNHYRQLAGGKNDE